MTIHISNRTLTITVLLLALLLWLLAREPEPEPPQKEPIHLPYLAWERPQEGEGKIS